MIEVRPADIDDIAYIVDLSARVQAKLTASGSLQQIGPINREVVSDYVMARAAYVLDDGTRLGSVFVRSIHPESFSQFFQWELHKLAAPVYFLSKLMIEPARQGQGLGVTLLSGAVALFNKRKQGTLTLDCWAGNEKLRSFYSQNGFALHGIYPEEDFQVAVFYRRPVEKSA